MAPFMDKVQLPQGYTATARRYLLFTTKCPRVPATHLINFHEMDGWNNLDLEVTLQIWTQHWESNTLTTKVIGETYTTKVIGETYLKCKCPFFISIKQTLHYKFAIE